MPSKLEIGDLLDDRYEILDIIGEGGFGLVYKAKQVSTGQLVAIKLLNPDRMQDDAVQVARFEREMKLIGMLKHPNIVRLIDKGPLESGALFTVLEFVDGETLGQMLARTGPMSPKSATRLMEQVLEALSCAHAAGIVHRDLKPANIMVSTSGARPSAMVLDFGIAAVVDEARSEDYITLTNTGQFHGTPAYMAPEQLRERMLTPQTDIYAWGLVFLELLIGRQVVKGSSVAEVIYEQMSPDGVFIPRHIRRHPLGKILEQATAKRLEERFSSANDVLAELDLRDVYTDFEVLVAPEGTELDPTIGMDATMDVGARDQGTGPGSAPSVPGIEGAPAATLAGDADVDTDAGAPAGDASGEETPGEETPGAETPGEETPGGDRFDTSYELDMEPPDDWGGVPVESSTLKWTVIGMLVVCLSAAALWYFTREDDSESQDKNGESATEDPGGDSGDKSGFAGNNPDDSSSGDEESDPAMGATGATGESDEANGSTSDVAWRGVLVPVTAESPATLALTQTSLVLKRLELAYYFDSNRSHRGIYTIHNPTDAALAQPLAIPMKTSCSEDVCEWPSADQNLQLGEEPLAGQLVGPMFDMKLYDPGVTPVSIESVEGVARGQLSADAAEREFDFLYVFNVTLQPGQTIKLEHAYTYSGKTVDGNLHRLQVDLFPLKRWADAVASLQMDVRWGTPVSYCLGTNQPEPTFLARKRRLRIERNRPPLDTPVLVEWVKPKSVLEDVIQRHAWLEESASSALVFDPEKLASALSSLDGPGLESVYTELLLAYRAAPNPVYHSLSLETQLTCGGYPLTYFNNNSRHMPDGEPDPNLTLAELKPGPRTLIEALANELERRGVAVERLPPE